jgi:hypothetical protein
MKSFKVPGFSPPLLAAKSKLVSPSLIIKILVSLSSLQFLGPYFILTN